MNSALSLQSVGITGLCQHTWLQLFVLFNKGFHSLAQAGLKLTMLSTQAGFKLSAILLPRSPECRCRRGKPTTPGIHFFNSRLEKPHKEKRKCVLNICLKACLSISAAPRVPTVGTAVSPHCFLLSRPLPSSPMNNLKPNRKLLSHACRVVESSYLLFPVPFIPSASSANHTGSEAGAE